jgi:hypothetical protein
VTNREFASRGPSELLNSRKTDLDAFYCQPGITGAHEKGGVKGQIGWFRRNHLVPVPDVLSVEALNAMIGQWDAADDARRIGSRARTVGKLFAIEKPLLKPLPEEPFETGRWFTPRVDRFRTPLPEAPPTVRDVTNWLTRRPDSLTGDEKPRLTAILDRCPELQTASDQVRAFAGMLTELTGQDLPQWIADASDAGVPGISSFARGLKQDLDAVTNGLTMPWSSGPVEGRVNNIKMIKRQMFGRAGLPLLRKRVLPGADRSETLASSQPEPVNGAA